MQNTQSGVNAISGCNGVHTQREFSFHIPLFELMVMIRKIWHAGAERFAREVDGDANAKKDESHDW